MIVREKAYRYYFYFLQERMAIFWRRQNGYEYPFSEDPILSKNKFTNVYRATDRVSQYLIKNIIYNKHYSNLNEEDMLLQILLFKIFNRIETWESIENEFGAVTINNYNPTNISRYLTKLIKEKPIFSSAYMMTGSHRDYNEYSSKHEKWLNMVEREFILGGKLKKITKVKSLEGVYNILKSCAFLGDFLSYQYTIDFNYSNVINFDENSFVKAGIGAIRGIKKCFPDLRGHNYEYAIRYTLENLEKYQKIYGFTDFKNLFGRNPTLIDIQNCFCETDKYLRVKMPNLQVDNIRIKQKFKKAKVLPPLFFPPKWDLNSKYENLCLLRNTKELTLS